MILKKGKAVALKPMQNAPLRRLFYEEKEILKKFEEKTKKALAQFRKSVIINASLGVKREPKATAALKRNLKKSFKNRLTKNFFKLK